MIAILDYGSGNIRSAQRAIERAGFAVEVTNSYEVALAAQGLVIPGVGAFASCMEQLRAIRGDELLRERVKAGRPILGICVGMQVLFQDSEENGGKTPGVALLPGRVERLEAKVLPQIGWNTVKAPSQSGLFRGLNDERFYFVHSYAVKNETHNSITSISRYGGDFVAAVETGSISAVQFHPEKSGAAGIVLLKNWGKSL